MKTKTSTESKREIVLSSSGKTLTPDTVNRRQVSIEYSPVIREDRHVA